MAVWPVEVHVRAVCFGADDVVFFKRRKRGIYISCDSTGCAVRIRLTRGDGGNSGFGRNVGKRVLTIKVNLRWDGPFGCLARIDWLEIVGRTF